jgi:hypothetical protein
MPWMPLQACWSYGCEITTSMNIVGRINLFYPESPFKQGKGKSRHSDKATKFVAGMLNEDLRRSLHGLESDMPADIRVQETRMINSSINYLVLRYNSWAFTDVTDRTPWMGCELWSHIKTTNWLFRESLNTLALVRIRWMARDHGLFDILLEAIYLRPTSYQMTWLQFNMKV